MQSWTYCWLVLCIIRIIIMYFFQYRALLAVLCIIRINIYYVFIMYSVLLFPVFKVHARKNAADGRTVDYTNVGC